MSKPNILIIEDNEDMIFTLTKTLKKEGYNVLSSIEGKKGLSILKNKIIDLVILDIKLPDINGIELLDKIKDIDPDILVLMMTAMTDAKPAIEAMKKGAYDYLVKPFELDELKLNVKKILETHKLKMEVSRLRKEHKEHFPENTIYGDSQAIEDIRNLINIVAKTPKTSVLILGESGTGKELVANAIHFLSNRASQPFIKLNCSAIPENLLESELFGHEKGAFTDARTTKKGLFELAHGGTIFLDEISSMKLTLQPKILRVIESQIFRRIGGTTDINIDVRVIAASNTDLRRLVNQQEFRDDLYYRLKVLEIKLPPLRERKEDILLLAKYYIQLYNKEFNKDIQKIDKKTEKMLHNYSWPGNVRELKNVIERSVILCNDEILTSDYLPMELQEEKSPVVNKSFGEVSLQEMEKQHILHILKTTDGNKSKASRILNISRSTLREKLKSYKISESDLK
ncbi:MAG: sigma-54 dependent transcriptional regulator [bacterium]